MLTFKSIVAIAQKEDNVLDAKAVKAMFGKVLNEENINLERAQLALERAEAEANVDPFRIKELKLELKAAKAAAGTKKEEINHSSACSLAKLASGCSPQQFVNAAVDAKFLSDQSVTEFSSVVTAQANLDNYTASVSSAVTEAKANVTAVEGRIAAIQAAQAALFTA